MSYQNSWKKGRGRGRYFRKIVAYASQFCLISTVIKWVLRVILTIVCVIIPE